jgi:hypothetical protein
MKISSFAALGLATGVMMLAACSGGPPSSATNAVGLPQSSALSRHYIFPSRRLIAMTNARGFVAMPSRHRAKSWVSPVAKDTQYLLYVADTGGTGNYDIYNYKSQAGKLFGTLHPGSFGFSMPTGSCEDTAGNVYIVDAGSGLLWQFPHGSSSGMSVAITNAMMPLGCSVDPTTGNIAVSNFGNSTMNIFQGGFSGTQILSTALEPYMWSPGYDPSGNLFVESDYTTFTSIELEELPAGSSTWRVISLPNQACGNPFCFPDSVQWDGTYLEAGDQNFGTTTNSTPSDIMGAFRISVSGSTGTEISSTTYKGNCATTAPTADALQIFVGGTTRAMNGAVFGNIDCAGNVNYYNYTAGGAAKRSLPVNIAPVQAGYGISVSAMKN